MAHIVYLTTGITSFLNASYALAHRLRARGHRVTYVSPVEVGEAVTAQGFPFVPLGWRGHLADDPAYATFARRRFRDKLLHLPETLRTRRAMLRRLAENDTVAQVLGGLAPDLLLVDLELHAPLMASARLGLPTVLFTVWYTVWKAAGVPPLHSAAIPDGSLGSRVADELRWLGYRLRKIGQRGWKRLTRFGTDPPSVLKNLARHHGFPFAAAETHQWPIPFAYRTFPLLSTNAREMDFPHHPPDRLHYLGPLIDPGRKEPRTDARFEALLRPRLADRSRPRIYCSLGTFWQTDRAFLDKVFRVFAAHPAWDLVLGLGQKSSVEALGPMPPNVYAFGWVPQLDVLRHADAALTHGGISTINECVRFGVPMVVYSSKKVDQNGCAARVAYHGLGIMADKDRDTADDIGHNLTRVLTEPGFRVRVAEMRRHFLRYEAEDVAVRTVEGFLKPPPTPPSG